MKPNNILKSLLIGAILCVGLNTKAMVQPDLDEEMERARIEIENSIRELQYLKMSRAIQNNNLEEVQKCIEDVVRGTKTDVNYNPGTEEIESPLMQAILRGNNDIVTILLQAGAKPSWISLPFAMMKEHNEITLTLLRWACHLTPAEKITVQNTIKMWLLVEHRLRKENRGLPTDLKKHIAGYIYRSFAPPLLEKCIQIGVPNLLRLINFCKKVDTPSKIETENLNNMLDENQTHINYFLDLNFLGEQIHKQTLLPKPGTDTDLYDTEHLNTALCFE